MVLRTGERDNGCEVLTVSSPCFLSFILFLSSGGCADGKGWILLVEGSGGGGTGGGSGFGFWASAAASNVGITIAVTAIVGLALTGTVVYSRRVGLKSPWSRRRRKHALVPKLWKSFFTPDGKLSDGGVKFLKKVRDGGVDPSLRTEVWPFLLGVYDINSSQKERDLVKIRKRKEYDNLRKHCQKILKCSENSLKLKETSGNCSNEGSVNFSQVLDSLSLEEVVSASRSLFTEGGIPLAEDGPTFFDHAPQSSDSFLEEDAHKSGLTFEDVSAGDTESTDSDSWEESEDMRPLLANKVSEKNDLDEPAKDNTSPSDAENESSLNAESESKILTAEDFANWRRIIRLDALRANDEWFIYSPSQAAVSEMKAHWLAESVGLNEYDHLDPSRVFHAARLVAILEAYAVYDPEIGYCQGMSDLLAPIITVFEEDHEAFWCFVGFMKKARHNFRLDEVGIQRQLKIVSKIIKGKDIHLYRHLEKLQAEDCFFVYRMVVVLFRRELSFEQTLCLWEVIWADQAAIRAGIAKSTWGRIRLKAPPNDDLLLYAIAACVLQRRKLIIEKYSGMDEIMKECNSMAGHLDVWKLLDGAHDLVVTLHDKI
ncbi:hypothetical protein I3843_12G077200 [Carya illinoinensis]|uniref:Rab-GAP TBC domain-containing protein n=1 Tax=Carya illinoinensis TaxID=32201 RepID=A0A8T1NYT7_CARIL|nr:rab GTPase-activating protein 22-like isoform X1 [Carya illinoinensis]KAG2676954.1 hypothetical protein I3760_12G075200 [Carya illinoinensis]KAG6633860.1 hypothetical protein CIPAW_12G077500 [Carya illinoinensis]KAG6684717.1 hypothetical protein I3842_12G076100 [Carya illinoinensis]KAG7952806.1 hypothetical protein I3843_12G077200 [Carya illinoinensis]